MELVKYPRGRAHARAIDAPPVPDPDHHLAHGTEPAPDGDDAAWIGWRATDELGRTVGRVEGRIDEEWLVVRDRRSHHLLVPIAEAIAGGDAVFLPYPQELIEDAPRLQRGETEVPAPILEQAREHYGAKHRT